MRTRYLTPVSLCEIIDFYPHEGLFKRMRETLSHSVCYGSYIKLCNWPREDSGFACRIARRKGIGRAK